MAAALVAGGTDDAPYARLLEHLSIYLDAHWRDGMAPFLERIRALPRVATAVELGCSVGRVVAEMLKRFDSWHEIKDLPAGTAERAEQLFKTVNAAFGVNGK